MSVKQRREREKNTLCRKILDAARKLFVREGYDGVSMRKLAEEIEYSPTSIYLHFRDKEELFRTLCDESFAKLMTTLEQIHDQISDPWELLRRGLRAYVDFGLQHPNHYQITFCVPSKLRKKAPSTDIGDQAFTYLRVAVDMALASGKMKPVDAETTSQALWAAVHGITSLLIIHPHFVWADRDRLIDHLIDVQLDGLKA